MPTFNDTRTYSTTSIYEPQSPAESIQATHFNKAFTTAVIFQMIINPKKTLEQIKADRKLTEDNVKDLKHQNLLVRQKMFACTPKIQVTHDQQQPQKNHGRRHP